MLLAISRTTNRVYSRVTIEKILTSIRAYVTFKLVKNTSTATK